MKRDQSWSVRFAANLATIKYRYHTFLRPVFAQLDQDIGRKHIAANSKDIGHTRQEPVAILDITDQLGITDWDCGILIRLTVKTGNIV